jgi:thioredoxin reductase
LGDAVARDGRYDCIIVGGGAAGLSAAIVLGRARRSILVIDAGLPRNAPARAMHGFLSREGSSPRELLEIARSQLARYANVSLVSGHADDARSEPGGFAVTCASGATMHGTRLLLATGVRDELPPLEGLDTLWGERAFTCPYCDAWEFRERRVGVYGTLHGAAGLAEELSRETSDVFIAASDRSDATDEDRAWLAGTRFAIFDSPVVRLARDERGDVELAFADGTSTACAALFLSVPLVQTSDLAERLGCAYAGDGRIAIDEDGRTSVANCYAAGDCANAHHQVAFAAAGGAAAAIAINEELLDREIERVVRPVRSSYKPG